MDKTEKFFYLPQATNASFVPSPSDGPSCTPEPLEPEPDRGPAEPAGKYPLSPAAGASPFLSPKRRPLPTSARCASGRTTCSTRTRTPQRRKPGMTLRQGQENYRKWGAVREDLVRHAWPPRPGEQPL